MAHFFFDDADSIVSDTSKTFGNKFVGYTKATIQRDQVERGRNIVSIEKIKPKPAPKYKGAALYEEGKAAENLINALL